MFYIHIFSFNFSEHYRSAVKSLHSTFSITSDKNYLKSSPDDRCSDENVFNAAELPEDTLNGNIDTHCVLYWKF